MNELIIAFVTGITTGGLSCLAVQGGLLASSMASQIEADIAGEKPNQPRNIHVAAPILWFLLAKLIAYTLLGLLLGWIGSMIQLSPLPRAILQIAIGIFMLGNALRLLNVHPIFRSLNIEPPAFIRKYIRQKSKKGDTFFTPSFLGALTVLIPCGITQVMMAAAIATGDPLRGAALLFAFILGTSPIFFVVAYFATRLGSVLEKYFMKFVAVVVLVIGLFTINTGLNLLGSPLSLNRVFSSMFPAQAVQASAADPAVASDFGLSSLPFSTGLSAGQIPASQKPGGCGCGMMNKGNKGSAAAAPAPVVEPTAVTSEAAPSASQFNEVTVEVQNTGYSPETVEVKAGVPTRVTFKSNQVYSCSLAIVIPGLGVQFVMDPTDTKTIELPALNAGDTLPFSCSMGMYTGVFAAR